MKSKERKAVSGMGLFVAAIFVIAMSIAGVYFLVLTPGDVALVG